MTGPRRVRPGQDRVGQDARLRRADARPHHRRRRSRRKPLGLVLVPTRELAVQVAEVLEPVAAARRHDACSPVYGGASRHHQVDELAKGVEIVVATPLRLIDLLKSGEVELGECQIVALDEADRMADDGFTPQVEWILRHCTGRNQTMLFSATLDGDVGHLIRHYLTDPDRRWRSTRRPTRSARCTTSSSPCTTWTRTR